MEIHNNFNDCRVVLIMSVVVGYCETCGRWDSNLKEGMCKPCVLKFK